MEKMAQWLERESLHRSLAMTNLIESPQSGVRKRTGNVCCCSPALGRQLSAGHPRQNR